MDVVVVRGEVVEGLYSGGEGRRLPTLRMRRLVVSQMFRLTKKRMVG
jgi:hypothetical protein